MELLLDFIWIAFFLVLIFGVFFCSIYSKRYFSILKSNFPDEWSHIKDEGVHTGEMKTQVNMFKFIVSKNCEKIGSAEFVRLAKKLRLILLMYISIFSIFFMLTIYMSVSTA